MDARTMPATASGPVVARSLPLPLLIAAFCLIWSSAFSVAKLAIADCPPLILLATRFVIAGLIVFAAVAVYRTPWRLSARDIGVFALLGIANQAVYLGLSYVGMHSVSSGLTALVISANPVLTALLASLVLGERMTWGKALGLLLGVGGVALIVQSRLANGTEHWDGLVFIFAALVSLVGGTILFKLLAPKGGIWIGNGIQSLAAGVALAPFALSVESVGDIVPSWRLLVAFAYLTIIASVFGYLLWFHLLAVSGATAASSYHFLMPPLGMLFGWLLLSERVEAVDLIGIVPVALGIYLVTRAPSPSKS